MTRHRHLRHLSIYLQFGIQETVCKKPMAKNQETSGLDRGNLRNFPRRKKYANSLDIWYENLQIWPKIKKLVRNFEISNGSIFKKLWGLKVEVVSYKKLSVVLDIPKIFRKSGTGSIITFLENKRVRKLPKYQNFRFFLVNFWLTLFRENNLRWSLAKFGPKKLRLISLISKFNESVCPLNCASNRIGG